MRAAQGPMSEFLRSVETVLDAYAPSSAKSSRTASVGT